MSGGTTNGGGRPAVFLDRDGTIIEDAHYVSRPEQVALLPGAAAAIRRLNEAGLPVIVVTNQSGIARGLLNEEDFARVQQRMIELLAAEGASIDATYHCPHHPELSGPCDCRKPGRALYERAAAEHGLSLPHSTFVGDRWRDVAPARELGGRGILVPSRDTPYRDMDRAREEASFATTLGAAVDRILGPPPRGR